MGDPLSIGSQISLLVFMIIASKGAAGVTGAGLATLAGGLQSHRPELLDGVGLIVGIDRFMSEARALTNLIGNGVATAVVAPMPGMIATSLSWLRSAFTRWILESVPAKFPTLTM